MEKLIFHKQKSKDARKSEAIVRLDLDSYRGAQAIADETGLPLVRVVSALVDFALEHTEVVSHEQAC